MGILDSIVKISIISGLCILALLLMWLATSYVLGRRRSEQGNVEPVKVKKPRFEEKREHPRAELKWPVTMETPQGPLKGETKNISLGGAFICCENPLATGQVFPLSIEIDGHKSLNVTAEVVWNNAKVPDDIVVTRGMGIRILEISAEDRRFVTNAVQSHLEKNNKD